MCVLYPGSAEIGVVHLVGVEGHGAGTSTDPEAEDIDNGILLEEQLLFKQADKDDGSGMPEQPTYVRTKNL